MTSLLSPRYRRGASLAIGGMTLVAGTMLVGLPPAGAEPTADAVTAINERYTAFGGDGSLLGAPVADAVDVPGGAARDYQGGAIYYSKSTGAHVMYGAILERYRMLGGPDGELGFPTNDESDTGDGIGRFNNFTTPGGASMYWTPQWGASVVKGRVLDAWRQSGAVAGPFGYPSADTMVMDGVQTGKFVGPDGTTIQWSQDAGLVTVPAALAATIPGFSAVPPTAEGTTSVTKPTLSSPAGPQTAMKSSKWWWIPVGLAVAALLAGVVRLLRRKPAAVEPVKVAAQRIPEVVPTPAPTAKTPPPVAPPPPPPPPPPVPPRPPVLPPTRMVPPVNTPAAPRPVSPPPPRPFVSEQPTAAFKAPTSDIPKATIRSEPTHQDVSPVIKYESQAPSETAIQVTYQNNAVGNDQAGVADKSDAQHD